MVNTYFKDISRLGLIEYIADLTHLGIVGS